MHSPFCPEKVQRAQRKQLAQMDSFQDRVEMIVYVRSRECMGEIVHLAPLPSARASYFLVKSDVDGGSALNLGSYRWQATSWSVWSERVSTSPSTISAPVGTLSGG